MGSRLEQKSNLVRKRIENHAFTSEDGEEYEPSKFGGFNDYFRRKKIKLQNLDADLRAQSADKPQIFKGIVCHVNGYTQPSLNDLHTLVVQHGGGFIQYLDGKTMVTHIIASNLTPKKKEEFKRYRIVKPAWIVDSVNSGKLLPWDAYRVIDEGVGQKVLGFERGQVVSQAGKRTQGYKEQTDNSWYTSQLRGQGPQPSSSSRKPPSFTQTATPDDPVDDENEYSEPEITSSIERALDDGAHSHVTARLEVDASVPLEPTSIGLEVQTPPPSSQPASPLQHADAPIVEEPPDGADCDMTVEQTTLRPREGSQEPDYSMAVVRDSEKLRDISPSRLAQMTAEEHNALLLSDPKIRKSTVVHPDFLEQYYRESRLHHLSTWKADLKSQLQALAAEKSSSQKVKLKKLPGQRRYIMHVDFDSFFAAVSLKKYPQYKDKPSVVAHGGGSGSEIASCNYPARAFGISNGMWMKRAQDLCPELKILPYDFPAYEEASRKFYDAIMATSGTVQSVSIDEALVDISAMCFAESGTDGVKRYEGAVHREQKKADDIAQNLRDEVLEKTGCAVSVGIGGNILQAKIALRKAKPAGQYQVKPEEVLDFIGQLEVTKLPGVAWSIGGKLEEIGIKLVKDIREVSKERLIGTLGPKTGEKMWEYARGIDRTEVGETVVRKSVSAEVNWGVRFENQEQVDEFMHGLCGELHKRLVKERVKGKQLTMKVMRRAADAPRDPPKHLGHGKCDTYNKSLQLGIATNDPALVTREAITMIKSFGISPGELRGIGVQMQKLEAIKAGGNGPDQGSQRRLQFMKGQPSKPSATSVRQPDEDIMHNDPIQEPVKTPEKQRVADFNKPSVPVQPVNMSTPTKKALNMLGTQFIMPTQVDPSVLAELPEEIRSKLAKHTKAAPPIEAPKFESMAHSPDVAFPTHSQLDPSILDALPEDLRAEVLGFYKHPRSPSKAKSGGQALLPQSPRKVRTIPTSAIRQPIKRKRGGGLFPGRARNAPFDNSTLTQSNFVARPLPTKHALDSDGGEGGASTTDQETTEDATSLDPDFLAALPPDLRREVLAQQRSTRLQRTSGLNLPANSRRRQNRGKGKESEQQGPSAFHLPPRDPVPTFTTRQLSALPDLRAAIRAWVDEFSDEGPYEEDVKALGKYLREVVGMERDLAKAVQLVKWMGWVVGEVDEAADEGVREEWDKALTEIKSEVQEAVRERGLGTVEFD